MISKDQIRKEMIQVRNQLPPVYRNACSEKINDHIMESSIFRQAQTILFYMAFRNEVDVSKTMKEAWGLGKKVILPRVNSKNHTMRCFEIFHMDECLVGTYGIKEPLELLEREIQPSQIDLVVVPGVAFDHQKYRLGFGGGYYDRFLEKRKIGQACIGVAFPEQIVESIYPELHDIQMHEVITGR